MAKSRFTGNPALYPPWPIWLHPYSTPAADSATVSLGAANARVAVMGEVLWDDGGTHSIHKVHYRMAGATPSGITVVCSLRDIDAANGPPGRDDGTIDQSYATGHADPAGAANYADTLDADRANVATGTALAVVVEMTARTSGSVKLYGIGALGYGHRPLTTVFDGAATWTVAATVPAITFEDPTGAYFGHFRGALPLISAAPTATAFKSDTAYSAGVTGKRIALSFTVAAPLWGLSYRVMVGPAAGASFQVILYEDTTAKATATFDYHTWGTDTTARWCEGCFPDVAFTAGHTYYLAVVPTTTTAVTIYRMPFLATGHRAAFAGTCATAIWTDSAWAAALATEVPVASVGFIATDDGASAAGRGAGYSRDY